MSARMNWPEACLHKSRQDVQIYPLMCKTVVISEMNLHIIRLYTFVIVVIRITAVQECHLLDSCVTSLLTHRQPTDDSRLSAFLSNSQITTTFHWLGRITRPCWRVLTLTVGISRVDSSVPTNRGVAVLEKTIFQPIFSLTLGRQFCHCNLIQCHSLRHDGETGGRLTDRVPLPQRNNSARRGRC